MNILGIDPGTADTGYGVIIWEKNSVSYGDYGSVRTRADLEMPKRLNNLYRDLAKIFEHNKPELVIIERLFFNTNAKTAISVGQARGVIMLLAAQHNAAVVEYTALQAKLAITGYGRASKQEMQKKVGEILKIEKKITPDDAADGLAMALCHLSKKGLVNFCE